MNLAYCMDCMEAMKQMPDKCFDLAVVDPPFGGAGGKIGRTGGTWAEKYAKKLRRGISPWGKNTSMSFSASHAIRSSGAATISAFRRRTASWFGTKSTSRKISQWRCASTLGRLFRKTQSCSQCRAAAFPTGSTPPKSQEHYTLGFFSIIQNRATRSLIPTSVAVQAASPHMTQGSTLWASRSTATTLKSRKNALKHTPHR